MIVMAIIVPVLVLIVSLAIAWYFFRTLRKNRQESQENLRVREELLPEEYGIRATQVGDSTLKVMRLSPLKDRLGYRWFGLWC